MIQAKILTDAIKILKVENSSNILNSSSDIKLKTDDGQVINCFIPAAAYIGKLSNREGFTGESKEEQAAVYQWLEYCLLHADCKEKEMLTEMNTCLKDKVYLVTDKFTIADLLLYLSLHELVVKLSFQEKELYCNLSRWFRLIQHEANACDLYPKVFFSKSQLYS